MQLFKLPILTSVFLLTLLQSTLAYPNPSSHSPSPHGQPSPHRSQYHLYRRGQDGIGRSHKDKDAQVSTKGKQKADIGRSLDGSTTVGTANAAAQAEASKSKWSDTSSSTKSGSKKDKIIGKAKEVKDKVKKKLGGS